MTQQGRAASGHRPLIVVLGEYSNFPSFASLHTADYYERLAFGQPTPPFTTSGPVNPASLSEYFREVSLGRFTFKRLGVVGPIALGVYANDPGPEARMAGILDRVATQSPQVFEGLDTDGDRHVGPAELCVVMVENVTGLQPANRDNNPVTLTLSIGGTKTIRVHVAGVGALTPFYQIAHELSHSLGTVDMYNTGRGNGMLTLMSAYSFFANDQVPVHLDIWHKLSLGWAEPRRFALSPGGSAAVHDGAEGAVILWDSAHGADEYFVVERRRPNAPGQRYDSGVAGDGVLIWRVQRSVANGVGHLGAPTLAWGGSGVWKPGQQTPELAWSDGQTTALRLSMSDATDGAIRVAWGQQDVLPRRARHMLLFHGGNGVAPVDSGLPMQGIFYGVTLDGHLDWHRYEGQGEPDISGVDDWHVNSGNLIGRGWGTAKHVVGCGDGVIMAVDANGLLRWYRYDGLGERDATGALGWHPNSGHAIGQGWGRLRHVLAFPRAGRPSSRLKMLAITEEGDLRWYCYTGNGEEDPSGTLGWHANSGNRIGNGWGDVLHVHGSGDAIFAVRPDGRLMWYSYTGQGEEDPSGTLGWHRHSGNPIGHGWQSMRQVFGGFNDVGGPAHVLMAADEQGQLFWYRYAGQGETDASGSLNWHPWSGNRIATNV